MDAVYVVILSAIVMVVAARVLPIRVGFVVFVAASLVGLAAATTMVA